MIGQRVRQKAKGSPEFAIVGFDQGDYILQNVAHGIAVRVTPEALRSDYGVPSAAAPVEGSDEAGWERLSRRLGRLASRPLRGPRGLTPEEALNAAAVASAKAKAAKIVEESDEERIASFEAGLIDFPPAVAAEVEALLAERR